MLTKMPKMCNFLVVPGKTQQKHVNSGKIGTLNFGIVIGNLGYVGSYGCN